MMKSNKENKLKFTVSFSVGSKKIIRQEFKLDTPLSVSREIIFFPKKKASNCFHLPSINRVPFKYKDIFIGDVLQGGACNVDILSYAPHCLTHIETSSHILNQDSKAITIKDIPLENLSGLVYLLDLSDIENKHGNAITLQDIKHKLDTITLPVTMLAIKTKSSLLPSDYDFSGKDFLYLSSDAAKRIHDKKPRINCLLLDLPSIDREKDGGKLLAHRAYFGLPRDGHTALDLEKRTLIELAYFKNLAQGYYYASIVPQQFQTNAVAVGIIFYPVLK